MTEPVEKTVNIDDCTLEELKNACKQLIIDSNKVEAENRKLKSELQYFWALRNSIRNSLLIEKTPPLKKRCWQER